MKLYHRLPLPTSHDRDSLSTLKPTHSPTHLAHPKVRSDSLVKANLIPPPFEMDGPEDSAKRRLLICDDRPSGRKMLRLLLTKALPSQWEILEAPHGEAAIEMAREMPFDLVTMDQNLQSSGGVMAGYQACLQLKQDNPHTVIIGVTGGDLGSDLEVTDGNTRSKFMEVGCLDVWGKPPPDPKTMQLLLCGEEQKVPPGPPHHPATRPHHFTTLPLHHPATAPPQHRSTAPPPHLTTAPHPNSHHSSRGPTLARARS